MNLSSDLISQFVKITNDDSASAKKETTVYGTARKESDGTTYVQIDGSDMYTPVPVTANVETGDRVVVLIKNHSAVITGNLTSPAVVDSDISGINSNLDTLTDKISDFETVVAKKVDTEAFNAEVARINSLDAKYVQVSNKLLANDAEINDLQADRVTVWDKLEAHDAEFSSIETDKLDATVAEATYATIENLNSSNTEIYNLKATHSEFVNTTADRLSAIDATIDDLEANKLTAKDIEGKYANIDFSNISKATMQWFYANSGLIENVVVGDGTITGNLVGVTIKGDLIEGNTIKAEKLVIKGTDGLYYKLNTDGVTTEAEQTSQNSLNGSVIMAKSIIATKISVDDLVAFDATIGGFNITDDSLYSGAKASVDNTTRGIYLDSTGQMAIGDASNFIKYYKDADGTYKLEISAGSILFGASRTNVETAINEVNNSADDAMSTANDAITSASNAETLVAQLADSLTMLVTDGNGTSLMTQTTNGWQFSTADIQTAVGNISNDLNSLEEEVGDVNHTVDILRQAVNDLGAIAEYVKIGTYEDEPCIELGEGDSDFRLRITNTRMIFTEGSDVLAYFNNQSLHIKKAVIEEELHQGGYAWVTRSNGHLSLVWKGAAN